MASRANTADLDLEDSELSAIIARELAGAATFDQTLTEKRTLTLQYLRGEMPDLPGRKNGSQQTDRTIADVISWMHPGIIRALTASDQMVRFAPVRDENPDWSEQATAYTNWAFWQNGGYRIVFNATHDGLSVGNGLVRCYYEKEQTKVERWNGVTAEDIAGKLQDEDPENIRILSQGTGEAKKVEGEDGVTTLVPTINLKVERILSRGKVCAEGLKIENLRVNALAVSLDEARLVAYLHDEMTRSDLNEMGFPREKVDALPAFQRAADRSGDIRRSDDTATFKDQSAVRSGDIIEVYECYLRADADGDGIAEMLQVWAAGPPGGSVILAWDYWDDEQPFTDIPCYPVPHQWQAESVADRTLDIQRVKTVLLRAMLDSTYASVVPQQLVKEGAIVNPDAVQNPRFGSKLWVKAGTPLADAVLPLVIPYTGDKSLVALQHMDEMVTKRTGISRTTMALDPEALTNQTATANQNLKDAGTSQVELVARNMAELGWAKFFSKWLKLAIKHKIVAKVPMKPRAKVPQQPGQPKQPEFQVINAAEWDENMAVSVNTGLGTGSRDRDMAMLNVVMGTQVQMATQLSATGLPSAKAKAIEFIPKIINSAVLLAESAGIKDPSAHYPEIGDADVAQMLKEAQAMAQQPNPAMQLEQIRGQTAVAIEEKKGQTTLQVESGKAQLDQQSRAQESQAQVIREQAQLQADLQTKEADRQNALIIERERQAFEREKLDREFAFRQWEVTQKLGLEREKLAAGAMQSAADREAAQQQPA